MDRFNPEANLVSVFSFLEELQALECAPASDVSHLHMAGSGRSVQVLDPPRCDQFSHQLISSALGSPQALRDYSIHYWSSFEKVLTCPGLISQQDLDEIVPVDSTVKDLATTNWQQQPVTFSAQQSSLAVTGPLLDSVAEACPPAEYQQQPLQVEPVRLAPGQPPVTIRISEVCQRAYQRGYHRAYHRALRAELNLSDDMDKARLAARVAGQAAGKAERVRVKATLVGIPAELRAVTPGDAYNKAYKHAYRSEMNVSGDRERARGAGQAAGQAAAKADREQVQNSSASHPDKSPLPNPSLEYQSAYHKAFRREMALSGDKDKAKKAAQVAGQAAAKAAKKALAERASSVARPKWIPIAPLL